jgi:hypothetical protein
MRRSRWAYTSHTAVSRSSRTRRRFLPRVEELENRTLLATGLLGALHAVPAAGVLTPAFSTGQNPPGYWPSQVRHAYGFDNIAADGTGQTIAIVDAYSNPNVVSDLAAFDQRFGLPGTDAAGINSFLTQLNQSGNSTPLPAVDAGWAGEIALDVEWAHAIAPGANIDLVEANSTSFSDLLQSVSTAANQPGVVAVSMSWGGNEFSSEASYDSYFTTPAGHTGETFVASTGDSGTRYGAEWPAASSHVLSVGGTTTNLSSTDTISSETAWNLTFNRFYGFEGGGGGASGVVGRPSYQTTYFSDSSNQRTVSNTILNHNKRLTPDVSLDANPNTGYALYFTDPSTGQTGWWTAGGTSAGAPQWAGLVALADQGRTASLDGYTQTLPALYQMAANATYSTTFNDTTSGSNGYSAGPGYDLATGLGTPKADKVVQFLTRLAVSKAAPSATGGSSTSSTTSTTGTSGTGHHGRPHDVPLTTPSSATQNAVIASTLTVSPTLLTPPTTARPVASLTSSPQRPAAAVPAAAASGAASPTAGAPRSGAAESGGGGDMLPPPVPVPGAEPPAANPEVVPPDGPCGLPRVKTLTLLPADDISGDAAVVSVGKAQDTFLVTEGREKLIVAAPPAEMLDPAVSAAALTVVLGGFWGMQPEKRDDDARRRRRF